MHVAFGRVRRKTSPTAENGKLNDPDFRQIKLQTPWKYGILKMAWSQVLDACI